jgi:hypothetical protein
MRICYFIAIASGQKLSSIFSTIAVNAAVGTQHPPELNVADNSGCERLIFDGAVYHARLVMPGSTPQSTSSTETSGKWDIYQIIPVLDDKKSTKDFYKALDAAQKSNANKVSTKRRMLGPWTAPQFAKLIWVGEKICYEQEPDSIDANGIPSVSTHKKPGAKLQLPWAIAGDDPIELAKEDYDGKEAK